MTCLTPMGWRERLRVGQCRHGEAGLYARRHEGCGREANQRPGGETGAAGSSRPGPGRTHRPEEAGWKPGPVVCRWWYFYIPACSVPRAEETEAPGLVRIGDHVKAPAEIIFEVTEAVEGGFDARALGYSIFTQGDDWADLKAMVKDAVACHFGDAGELKVVKESGCISFKVEAPCSPDEAVDTLATECEVNV